MKKQTSYCIFFVLLFLFSCKKEEPILETIPETVEEKPIYLFSYKLDNYQVVKDTVRPGDSFGQILFKNHVPYSKIEEIATIAKDTFDVRKINVGKTYTLLKTKDSTNKAQVFIYQKNKIDHVIINFKDSITTIQNVKKPIRFVSKTTSGVITSSLSEAIDEQGLDYTLANDLSDIYAWSIDFFRLQKGDQFKILYQERYIDDSIYAGIESIDAAVFKHSGETFYAFDFVADSITQIPDYYSETGKTLRSVFLKAPVNFSRISSRYSPRRFHPVQKRWKAHKGTDYAAPKGTPILATANGTVIKSSYSPGNGKYVKIRHNGTYSTQYLHMTKRNVKVGAFVKQGDVIGYVGSTGLATGPHVCYRFWKNGKQVDPYKQKLPEAKPLEDQYKETFLEFIKPLKKKLDSVPFQEIVTNTSQSLDL